MKARKLLMLTVVFCLPAVGFGGYTDIYISLDGINPAPNDVNIIAGETMDLYIVSPNDPLVYSYAVYWGTYWGTVWGTIWGDYRDRPWEQVIMALPSPVFPAVGNAPHIEDYSFQPELENSYDYECLAAGSPLCGQPESGPHFSTTITAIGAVDDKFSVGILSNAPNYPIIDEVIFTITTLCETPLVLTITTEPNEIGIDAVEPNLGENESCLGGRSDVSALRFPDCPDVYKFHHWIGDVNDPCSADTFIITDTNETVTAVFVPDVRECGDECHPILQGDLNEDCYTNFEDFSIYADMWLACTHPDCD